MQNLPEAIIYYNKGLEFIENDFNNNLNPYLIQNGVLLQVMANNGILKPLEYTNTEVYNSKEFKNIIASKALMTNSLLPAAYNISSNFDNLLQLIDEEINK